MRVTFNTNLADLQQAVSTAAQQMAVYQKQLSSGYRVTVPSDDPIAASAIVSEKSDLAASDQYQASADTATSRLTIVDSVMSELINQTTRAQSTALSACGTTVTDAQRAAAATTLESARDAIVSVMNTSFRGTYLFSGNDPMTVPYTTAGGVISTYQGGAGGVHVDIARQATVQVGFSGNDLLKGSDPKDLIQSLTDLAAAVRAGDQSAISQGTSALESAFSRLTTAQTKVGNDEAQLDTFRQQITASQLAGKSRLSTLQDADLAESVTNMNRANVAYQAALKAVSNATGTSLMDYLK